MPPDATASRLGGIPLPRATPWAAHIGALALVAAGLVALTWREWAAMAHQWWNIATYNHVLFVPAIAAWFAWQRRERIAHLAPEAWWPAGVLLCGCLFVWLVGSVAAVNTISQAGAVGALIAAVPLSLGLRAGRMLAFPLAYLVFLVPFGDELVPAMQMVTASIAIQLTRWSGIDAAIDGVFIDTPVGLFEVAEACSGVKFLVAMAALSALIAYACFVGWRRRALFVAAALALPIVANGVRAWATIAIAQRYGIDSARGFDHVFYGWVFFALVVAALLATSWRWFERFPEESGPTAPQVMRDERLARLASHTSPLRWMVPTVLVAMAGFGVWEARANQTPTAAPFRLEAPAVAGWSRVSYDPTIAWTPSADGTDAQLLARYRDPAGREVDVFLAVYQQAGEGRDPSAEGQGAVPPGTPWRWSADGPALDGAASTVFLAHGRHRRLAETSYRIGDTLTGSRARYKLAALRHRLTGSPAPSAMLILSTERDWETLAAFRAAIGDRGAWIDRSLEAAER